MPDSTVLKSILADFLESLSLKQPPPLRVFIRNDSYQQLLPFPSLWLLLNYEKMKGPVTQTQRLEPGGSEIMSGPGTDFPGPCLFTSVLVKKLQDTHPLSAGVAEHY